MDYPGSFGLVGSLTSLGSTICRLPMWSAWQAIMGLDIGTPTKHCARHGFRFHSCGQRIPSDGFLNRKDTGFAVKGRVPNAIKARSKSIGKRSTNQIDHETESRSRLKGAMRIPR